ncbi:transmembrane protein, putative (macronuclear) [Tetrahymena thermophila SB210]|uniref:Transmembrane protein, putative n=1 Tax=Tetrahymena thermophila (strain SB210) TaxID=312017 RepID=W7XG69_TETTS|nr:transmembrane protein, putative [Tetrahymena thermophila SB210]EWS71829.1 transmembrane protein, putative [Tetrahymena thermophila SB210]|eukprot:XP_012655622.1 transmembrane protein, putative [Tetrahymena thermophila SB210]
MFLLINISKKAFLYQILNQLKYKDNYLGNQQQWLQEEFQQIKLSLIKSQLKLIEIIIMIFAEEPIWVILLFKALLRNFSIIIMFLIITLMLFQVLELLIEILLKFNTFSHTKIGNINMMDNGGAWVHWLVMFYSSAHLFSYTLFYKLKNQTLKREEELQTNFITTMLVSSTSKSMTISNDNQVISKYNQQILLQFDFNQLHLLVACIYFHQDLSMTHSY